MGRVGEVFALPNHRTGFFVEGHEGTLATARSNNNLFTIDQRRLCVAPHWTGSSEVSCVILAPDFLARIGPEADHLAPLAHRKDRLSVSGRRCPWAFKLRLALAPCAGFAQLARPQR